MTAVIRHTTNGTHNCIILRNSHIHRSIKGTGVPARAMTAYKTARSKTPILVNFHSCTVQLHIIKVFPPTDAQENCSNRSIKIYMKIAPTCFGVITIIRECTI
jgi:hypothetical protein